MKMAYSAILIASIFLVLALAIELRKDRIRTAAGALTMAIGASLLLGFGAQAAPPEPERFIVEFQAGKSEQARAAVAGAPGGPAQAPTAS